jgi:hypothetical protein
MWRLAENDEHRGAER